MGIKDFLSLSPVIPVVAIDDEHDAVPLACALLKGGVPIIEVTLRTEAALRSIELIRKELPEMTVGCGTIKAADDIKEAANAGAQFLVSPGTPPALAIALQQSGLPSLPGAATVTEALSLQGNGFTALKFFPAQASGGPAFLAAIHSILPDITFCPTGGITTQTVQDYLNLPNVKCVGGSWLASPANIRQREWDDIADNAKMTAKIR